MKPKKIQGQDFGNKQRSRSKDASYFAHTSINKRYYTGTVVRVEENPLSVKNLYCKCIKRKTFDLENEGLSGNTQHLQWCQSMAIQDPSKTLPFFALASTISVEALVFIVIGRSCSEGYGFDSHCRAGSFLRFNSRPIMLSSYCAT